MLPVTPIVKSVYAALMKWSYSYGITLTLLVCSTIYCLAAEPATEQLFLQPLFSVYVVLHSAQPLPLENPSTSVAKATKPPSAATYGNGPRVLPKTK